MIRTCATAWWKALQYDLGLGQGRYETREMCDGAVAASVDGVGIVNDQSSTERPWPQREVLHHTRVTSFRPHLRCPHLCALRRVAPTPNSDVKWEMALQVGPGVLRSRLPDEDAWPDWPDWGRMHVPIGGANRERQMAL